MQRLVSGSVRIVLSALGIRFVNALLNALELYPERWVITKLLGVPTEAWLETARWGLAFLGALIVAGLWSYLSRPKKIAAAGVPDAETQKQLRMWDKQQDPSMRPARMPIPDMTIRDLFFHIRPDVLEHPEESRWEKVEENLRDKFGTDQLSVWGRELPLEGTIETLIRKASGLMRIKPDYWPKADFTFAFFDETAGKRAHVQNVLTKYTDLHVNRDEVLRIWPEESAQSRRLKLAKLRTEGVEIRNAGARLESDLPSWIAKTKDWMERTIKTIERVDEADAEWFKTLDAVPPPRTPIILIKHGEGAHLKAFREHDFRLHKLESLIEKYGRRD